MDALWTNLPPVTRGWNVGIITAAALITFKRVKSVNLLFSPDRAFSNQPWRIISSFFTFGELSMNLFMEFWFVSNSCRRVEDSFTVHLGVLPKVIDSFTIEQRKLLFEFVEQNKSIDFLYYMLQIALSIVAMVSFGYYKVEINLPELGKVLCHTLIYIDSRNSPNQVMNLFGVFQFKNVYYPWMCAIVHWLVVSVNLYDRGWKIYSELALKPLIWFYTVAYGLGHLWWLTRDFLLQQVHSDENDKRRLLRRDTLREFKVNKLDLVKEVLSMFFLPPWYWVIISKIQRRR